LCYSFSELSDRRTALFTYTGDSRRAAETFDLIGINGEMKGCWHANMKPGSSHERKSAVPRKFDAIVIGSGRGGLTAGALYARAGHRVLVLERNVQFGGAATVYRHGSLAIEASLHEIDGLDAEDPKVPKRTP
jgi:hypothetical protein